MKDPAALTGSNDSDGGDFAGSWGSDGGDDRGGGVTLMEGRQAQAEVVVGLTMPSSGGMRMASTGGLGGTSSSATWLEEFSFCLAKDGQAVSRRERGLDRDAFE